MVVESSIDISHFKGHVEQFLDDTEEARQDSERSRDYYNHYQWTQEEAQILRSRKQQPITINRVKPKIEGLKGLLIQRKTDPKAFPRTQEHEEAAHAVTDGLRYVADNVDFDETQISVAEDFFIEGYAGAIVEVVERNGEAEIQVNQIPWDRIYFDPHSRKHDFTDATYLGMIVWMDVDAAARLFGEGVRDQASASDAGGDETFDDRPRWFDGTSTRLRLRIAHEFYIGEGGRWHMVVFAGEGFLRDPGPSPYLDEFGEPTCPIELVSAYLDRDNRRFGEVRVWRDLQDEINHRRSKALHANSARQTVARKGAIEDVPEMKRELAKVDGHVEIDTDGAINDDWQIMPTGDMAAAQFDLLVHATSEMDAVGYNAQLAGERQGNLSGKAILALQGAGANEMAPGFAKLNGWEKRIYRQVWFRIRQFWTAEKWVRVTDDKNALRWVGFNVPITMQARLEEVINDDGEEEFTRKRAAQMLTQMMQAQDPRLQQPVMVRNEPGELDMDIILEQALDTVNTQAEQFELLATLAQGRPEIPFVALLRLSTLRDKEDIISEIEEGEQNQAQLVEAQAQAQQGQLEAETQAKIAVDTASTENELKKDALLNQQKIEAERQLTALKAAFEREKALIAVEAGNATEARSRSVIEIPGADRIASAVDQATAAQASDTRVLEELLQALREPRQVQRDDGGRVVAIV